MSPPPSTNVELVKAAALDPVSPAIDGPSRFPLKLDHSLRHTEKAERAVKASQSRRAPSPGGAVQMNRNLLRRPRKSNPVQRGRHDHPITSPIITATQIGTAQSSTSIRVSTTAGLLINSIKSA